MSNDLTLFDEFRRTDGRQAKRRESTFSFYNRSAWRSAENVRVALEQWFADYPADSKRALCARFRDDDDNHHAAFFELLLHQVLLRLGLNPKVDPTPASSNDTPDFLITDILGQCYYIEAMVVVGMEVSTSNALLDEVLDAIDAIAEDEPSRVALWASVCGTLRQAPKVSQIVNEVTQWLATIDLASIVDGDIENNPSLPICRGEWVLKLTVSECLKEASDRLIHTGPIYTGSYNEPTVLRRNIRQKASKYSYLEHPLIVAISAPSQMSFMDREYLRSILYSREHRIPQVDDEGNLPPAVHHGLRDGIWLGGSGVQHKELHGVLFLDGAGRRAAATGHTYTYINPYIDAKLPAELLQLGSARVEDGRVVYQEGPRLGEILGLPEDWPGPPGMPSE